MAAPTSFTRSTWSRLRDSPPRERPEMLAPGERIDTSLPRMAATMLAAITLPVLAAIAAVPLRADHAAVVALLMVVPVVGVSLSGSLGASVLAAASAGGAFAVFHTRPYGVAAIDRPDDLITTATLLVAGMTVGVICGRLKRQTKRASARRNELRHVLAISRRIADGVAIDDLRQDVEARLFELLDLTGCEWHEGPHGATTPVLLDSGAVMGTVSTLRADRSMLPDLVLIPAFANDAELGYFAAHPAGRRPVSAEERLTAATIVALFAHCAAPVTR